MNAVGFLYVCILISVITSWTILLWGHRCHRKEVKRQEIGAIRKMREQSERNGAIYQARQALFDEREARRKPAVDKYLNGYGNYGGQITGGKITICDDPTKFNVAAGRVEDV